MQKPPLISVVVPCYNAAPYLEECLASVRGQRVAGTAGIEVIVVDDGSTDGSGALLDALAAHDPRIRPLHQANAGVSSARNAGLDAARGEFVAFVDADDRLLPGALTALYARAAGDPAPDIVSSRHIQRYPDGSVRPIRPAGRCRRRSAVLALLIRGDGVFNAMYNKLYRRALLERWAIRSQPGLRVGEDALFNLEAYARAGEVAHLPAATYEYRIHGASVMGAITKAEHYARHLPWLDGIGAALSRLGLREVFFRRYCYSRALRLSRSRGVSGMLRAFNREVRPAVLEGVDPAMLRWCDRPLYTLVRAGLFPAPLCLMYPLLRAPDAARRAARWAAYLVSLPARLLQKAPFDKGGGTACS